MSILQDVQNHIEAHAPVSVIDFLTKATGWMGAFRSRQIKTILELTKEKPLILTMETVSICNAACVFCAYPDMERKKEIQELSIFEKVVREYSEMGGGAVSLTPVMGDALLDPDLMKRFETLKKYPNINQISLTTNGIAFKKYSDDQIKLMLRDLFLIQLSIGGLDRETYKLLYKVDALSDVLVSAERILKLRNEIKSETQLILAFRTNNPHFERDYKQELKQYKARGVLISHIYSYQNFGGQVKTGEVEIRQNRGISKNVTCALPYVQAAVYSNGKVTNCGCVDANGNGLLIGDSKEDAFSDVWQSERRNKLLTSFSKGKVPGLCQSCSAYRPYTYLFATKAFKKIKPNHKLPLEFYLDFFGA